MGAYLAAEGLHDLQENNGVQVEESQLIFDYKDNVVDALEATISSDRFATYLKPAGFDKRYAIQLYVWNSRLSEALHLPLQTAEVTLRNSVNERLCYLYGAEWPTSERFRSVLGEESGANLDRVRGRIVKAKYAPVTGRIVAGLSFDFWASLFKGQYDRPIWQTGLHATFPLLPAGTRRGDVADLVNRIRWLRNRVAHYEPIFKEDLSYLHTIIIRLISFRCSHTADWVRHHSILPVVMRSRPAPGQRESALVPGE
ncbi:MULTISPECIES: hypothetical protein [unclassified Azospirillum]|uniref:hypothetical protein n=1 Tax=unclassified Azospirillum TaxID=2630922 RepID=UPI0011B254A3|nr:MULTISPECIES: hypothetical protein [unclassified Azospirillum]